MPEGMGDCICIVYNGEKKKPGNNLNIKYPLTEKCIKLYTYRYIYMNLYTYTQIVVCYAVLKMNDLCKVQ